MSDKKQIRKTLATEPVTPYLRAAVFLTELERSAALEALASVDLQAVIKGTAEGRGKGAGVRIRAAERAIYKMKHSGIIDLNCGNHQVAAEPPTAKNL